MLINLGYDIQFEVSGDAPMVTLLNVHPSRVQDLQAPDELRVEPEVQREVYTDGFGNICCRIMPAPGPLRLWNSTVIYDSGEPDVQNPTARQLPIPELPVETLPFLLASRYCEVDLMSNIAFELFGQTPPGWERVRGNLYLGQSESHIWLQLRSLDQDGA